MIPGLFYKVHDMIFLMVMPDLTPSSYLKSYSVSELRMLPSMASYSMGYGGVTEFGVELFEADELEPFFDVEDCPFDGFFGDDGVELLVIH